jgi:hypothetical protein
VAPSRIARHFGFRSRMSARRWQMIHRDEVSAVAVPDRWRAIVAAILGSSHKARDALDAAGPCQKSGGRV